MFKKLQSHGFTVKNGLFNLLVVSYENTEVMYLRKNNKGNYDTIEFLNFPSSFEKFTYNKTIDQVITILKSIVKNNFKSN